jgi:hypothetical protein
MPLLRSTKLFHGHSSLPAKPRPQQFLTKTSTKPQIFQAQLIRLPKPKSKPPFELIPRKYPENRKQKFLKPFITTRHFLHDAKMRHQTRTGGPSLLRVFMDAATPPPPLPPPATASDNKLAAIATPHEPLTPPAPKPPPKPHPPRNRTRKPSKPTRRARHRSLFSLSPPCVLEAY